jgi:N-acetylneuraminic acid mutarotase
MKKNHKFLFTILFFSIICFQFSFLSNVSTGSIPYPIARAGHNMIYCPIYSEIVLFGGMKDNLNNQGSYLNDTWVYHYSNNTWVEIESTTRPSNRNSPSMVYDSLHNSILLFGGSSHAGFLNDTWQFKLSNYQWSKIDSEISPPKSADAEMFFDLPNNEIVLFGGYTPTGYSDETWVFNINDRIWEKQNHTIHPSSRYGHRIVYSRSKDSGILFAGHAFDSSDTINNDMWLYNCTNKQWSEMTVDYPPPIRYWHDMIYDEKNEKIVLFGGRKNGYTFDCWGDTWEYTEDNNQWTEIETDQSPEARMFCSMVYNEQAKKVILFGGNENPNTTIFDDLWEYDANKSKWKQIIAGKKVSSIPIISIIGVLSLMSIVTIIRRKNSTNR